MSKILIDAGHNDHGSDTGALGNGLREQDISYALAQMLGAKLQSAGIEVKYTRQSQGDCLGSTVNESLNLRAQMANNWGADYFISLHCNAGGGTGAETYCVALGGQAEQLAKSVQAQLTAATGLRDRGVKTANYAVLRNTNMPAILVECGFIDHPSDASLMGSEAGQNKIAEGIAKGVFEFMGIEQTQEYVTPAEAVSILVDRGIIVEPEKWYNGTWNDDDFKWLLRKVGTYLKNR